MREILKGQAHPGCPNLAPAPIGNWHCESSMVTMALLETMPRRGTFALDVKVLYASRRMKFLRSAFVRHRSQLKRFNDLMAESLYPTETLSWSALLRRIG